MMMMTSLPQLDLETLAPVDALDIVDVRSPHEYQQHHVQGSLSVPLEQLVAQKTLLATKNRLLLLGSNEAQTAEAHRLLQALGFEAKTWSIPLGYAAFKKHPQAVASLQWVAQPLGATGHVKHWYGQLQPDEKKLALGAGAVLAFTALRSLSPLGLGITLGGLGLTAVATRKKWQPLLKEHGLKETLKGMAKAWILKKM
ncbi:MAG: rhodanese-like domain-containing protein [Vampirovibrionales bacterium]